MNIHESINRILASEAVFGEAFYDVFLRRYPQVQQYFATVNMQRQAVVLTMAMLVIEQYHSSTYPAMAKYLRNLGIKHRERGIPRATFPYFHDALLEALKQFHGDDWNDDLALRWDIAIDHTTEQLLKGYDES